MNEKYLGNHAVRLDSLNQLNTESEIYVVGRGKDAFIAFRLPPENRIKRRSFGNVPDDMSIKDIKIYEAVLYQDGSEIQEGFIKEHRELHIDQDIDVGHMGVFRPTEGSKLRKILEEKLSTEMSREAAE